MGGMQAKFASMFKGDGVKVIVVFGATGTQGGVVARAIMKDNSFQVRVVTRNSESERAKELAEAGAELVEADMDDVESLNKVLEGAYGVFAVTNFWEHKSVEKEVDHGKNMAEACKAQNVRHLVYATHGEVGAALNKESPPTDAKHEITEHIKELDIPFTKVIYPFYFEQLLTTLKPMMGDDGTYVLMLPMEGKPLDMVPVSETGECIRQLFRQTKKYLGKTVSLTSHRATVQEYADILNKHVTGKSFKPTEMTPEDFRKSELPEAGLLYTMFEFYQLDKVTDDVIQTKRLHPKINDFESWVEHNKEELADLD